jgi:serine/threonine-protein kinase
VLGLLLAAGVILAIVLVNNDDNSASTVTVTSTTATTGTVTTQPQLVDVPDVRGDTQLSSVSTLQDGGLYANTFPVRGDQQRGTVVAQNPTGGRLAEGSPVRLNVSIGNGDTPEVGVPDVAGSQADDARLSLARSKLCMRTLTQTASSPDEVGTVLTQSPSAGASSSQFAQVTIYVGA